MSKAIVIETFRDPTWALGNLRQTEPSAFNAIVDFRKWRITAEIMDEPVEVLRERLQSLWDHCDNHHHWKPLRASAKTVGLELAFPAGSKRKKP